MRYNNKVLKLLLALINRIGTKMNLILRVCAFILKLTLPNIKLFGPEGAFVAHTLNINFKLISYDCEAWGT